MEARDRIRKFREKKGLSTNDVSRLTGISQSTISKLENGKRKANLEILEKIAVALEVSVDRLTGDSVSSIIENRLGGGAATYLPPYLPPSPPLFTPGPFLSQFVGIIFNKGIDLNAIKVYT